MYVVISFTYKLYSQTNLC